MMVMNLSRVRKRHANGDPWEVIKNNLLSLKVIEDIASILGRSSIRIRELENFVILRSPRTRVDLLDGLSSQV